MTHGDDYQGELKANFSSNIWYNADNSALYLHLAAKLPTVRRYPEMESESLKQLLAEKLSLKNEQLTMGNGSVEIIYRIAQAHQNKKSLIVSPTFSEYAKACELNNHKIKTCAFDKLDENILDFQPDLVWICNPNNPNGYFINNSTLTNLFAINKNTIFIIDQSFIQFCRLPGLENSDINKFKNIILIYSLTKRYSIPGLRLGYAVSDENIMNRLNRFTIPWSVNSLAIEAAKYIFGNKDNFDIDEWLLETDRFRKQIDALGIFETKPGVTPFFLVKLLRGKAADLKEFLLNDGLLIRNANNFETNGNEFIRLITLGKQDNNKLINKLSEWKSSLLE
jgi:Histidinol-phosphate/aromatic aminotransferase and cobyric acid decarboxylase